MHHSILFCGTHKVNLLLSYLEDNSKVALLAVANKGIEDVRNMSSSLAKYSNKHPASSNVSW
jgi:hypothetical protein